jgi:hypothetical protein
MSKPQIAENLTVDEMMTEIKAAAKEATKVVGWYAHPGNVRGPFCRWFEVTPFDPEYEKYVGTQAADAKYASVCMNYAQSLVEEIERLRERSR